MASRAARKQRQRIRDLEAALQEQRQASALLTYGGSAPLSRPVRKAQYPGATYPVPRTTRAMVEPVYPSSIPPLEPYRPPSTFGGYQRGQLLSGYGQGVSWEMLRLAAKRCLLLAPIHSCLTHDIVQLSHPARDDDEIGWRARHEQSDNEDMNTDTPEIRARCARVERIFCTPHPVYETSFRGFLSKCMDDYLTLNRIAIELIRNQRGEVVQFRAIDPATILPTYRILQRFVALRAPEDHTPQAYYAAARLLESETGIPIADSEYVCVMQGQLVGSFAVGDLLVWEDLQTTDIRILFPPSYVEKALEGIIAWIYAFNHNKIYWTHGNMTEVMIGIHGEIDDEGFVAFQEQMHENTSGLKGAWKVPILQLPVDGGLEVVHLKENHRDMQFQEWMTMIESLVCGIYRTTKRRIDLPQGVHEGSGLLANNQAHEQIEAAKEESFLTHSAFLQERFTALVKLIDPELEFVWTGLDVEDREAEIKIETDEIATYRGIDEIRKRHGDAPFNKPWSKVPVNQLIFQAEGLGQTEQDDAGPPGKPGEDDQADTEADAHENALDAMGFDDKDAAMAKALEWEEVIL